MFKELDIAVLRRDVPEHDLKSGDIGAIVHCYDVGEMYEVEFVDAGGKTVALLTLGAADIRAMDGSEILHVRGLEKAAA
ncbi:DUF4926 domain-containing protein [Desulfobacca acetoxidans]|uniref:DUF4926 domain-containing protein n=1 Tax=Desulfobacca acetoxidans (strain ATCC 700848 / DSM 11109 / ASRB2) TaxID=880072 RepID=F2NCL2_DESAR|nr:DUF4926 domain-containing protein [Desulfobacca acetoxidans]AEB09146.1 hypothetical protein Desac_1289 [Desulfobacca acetoxidans DSM 11109]HAY22293.1 DUF4926 domain-containing protein [Desulfobacterales bacterium]